MYNNNIKKNTSMHHIAITIILIFIYSLISVANAQSLNSQPEQIIITVPKFPCIQMYCVPKEIWNTPVSLNSQEGDSNIDIKKSFTVVARFCHQEQRTNAAGKKVLHNILSKLQSTQDNSLDFKTKDECDQFITNSIAHRSEQQTRIIESFINNN